LSDTNKKHVRPSLLLLTPAAYQAIIANDPGAEGGDNEKAPRPNKPADRGPGSALRARMDTRRVMHARYEQQSRLIRCGLYAVRMLGPIFLVTGEEGVSQEGVSEGLDSKPAISVVLFMFVRAEEQPHQVQAAGCKVMQAMCFIVQTKT
jgi:hypothetical protein